MREHFTINKRLLSDIFAKHRNTFDAFCELVNNSLQAKAKTIWLTFTKPAELLSEHPFERITIRDNGIGVSKSEFHWKILEIATEAKQGGKGVGRFAALQLGATMRIETVSFDQFDKQFYKSSLTIDTTAWGKKSLDRIPLDPEHEKLEGKTETYYEVTITNFHSDDVTQAQKHLRMSAEFDPDRVEAELFSSYADILISGRANFVIDGKPIDPKTHVIGEPEEREGKFTTSDGTEHVLQYQFMEVQAPGRKHRVFLRVKNGDICTVAHAFDYSANVPAEHRWFVFVDSKYFDSNTDLFRGLALPVNDPDAELLQTSLKEHLDGFFAKKYEQYGDFVEHLKSDTAYPYREREASSESRSVVFNQIAYHLEEQHHLLGKRQDIRKLVYRLIDRALNQGDFEDLLGEIVKLDDATAARFRELIREVDLEEVIAFCDEVRRKEQYLDFLYKLVYGSVAEFLKERSQLHKIVQKHLWLFGERYNGTPVLFSDKNLQDNLARLREQFFAYEPTEKDGNLAPVDDEKVKTITDLFFFNEKILDDESREVMVVELKAPNVKLHQKELNQAEQYAFQIEQQGVFPDALTYRVILVSSDMSDFLKAKQGQVDSKNPWVVYRSQLKKSVEVWAVKWSDIIEANRRKLSYLGKQLHSKDREVKDVWQREFGDVPLQKIASHLRIDSRP